VDSDQSVEVLLLLCCLVGAVAFVCFAMGAVNLAAAIEKDTDLNPEQLARERDSLLVLRRELTRKVEELSSSIDKELKQAATDPELQKKLDRLDLRQRTLATLQERRRELERVLSKASGVRPGAAQELEKLEREILDVQSRLAGTEEVADDEFAGVTDREVLKQRIAELDARLRQLGPRLSRVKTPGGGKVFNPYVSLQGATAMKNPLFVECREGEVVFHPSGRTKDVPDDYVSGDILGSTKGHDAIVLLVRPSGLRVFRKCLEELEGAPRVPTSEPIDEDWPLDFSSPDEQP
jgi:hypothetical protein